MNGDFFEEGDVLELTLVNGEKIRALVELKGVKHCKVTFCAADKRKSIIGVNVRLEYKAPINFSGTKVTSVEKIPNEFSLTNEHLKILTDLALQTKDKDWFDELLAWQKGEVG